MIGGFLRRLRALTILGIRTFLHLIVRPFRRRAVAQRRFVALYLDDDLLPTRRGSRDLMVQAARCTGCGLCDARCALDGRLPLNHPGPSFIPRALIRAVPDLAAARGDVAFYRECGDCRACEAWCPHGVPLQALLDDAAAVIDRLDRMRMGA